MRFGLLGTLEVVDDDGRVLDLRGAQPRAVIGMLLVAGGRVVSTDAIIEALWGESPPPSAAGTLQSYVSRLRRDLEPNREPGGAARVLVWDPPGYRLAIDPESVDAYRFERLADEGRMLLDTGQVEAASAALAEADALWRGPALLDLRDHSFATGVAARLEERRSAAAEDRFAAELRLGRHAAVVGDLTEAVAAHPLREGLRAQLALALYRSGRQAEALRAIDDARRTLLEELGVDPGRPLRELEAQILAHDRALDAPRPPADPQPPAAAAGPTTARGQGAGPIEADRHATGAPTGSEFVGRTTELDRLRASLAEAIALGVPRIVVLEGEPGIGKTRLAEELGSLATADCTVVWGRCYEGGAAPAFWPWLAALRAIAEVPGFEPAPELSQLLVPSSKGQIEAQLPPGAPSRFALFEAVEGAIAAASASRPLVVILDDMQWADQASLELLAFLAGSLLDGRVLLVLTVRDVDAGIDGLVEALAAVARRSGSWRLHLRGLDEQQTAELLAATAGGTVDPSLASSIHARAGGNPFFAAQLARLLGSSEAPAAEGTGVPAGVRDVIRQRLARLPEATLELLRVAAIVGRETDVGVASLAAQRPVDDCLDAFEPAIAQRLVVAVADQPGTFRFVHALVREVLADDLSSLRRARLHLRVADAIAERFGDLPDAAEIVAEHLWAAAPIGVGRRAAAALDRAAEVAVRRLAYEAGEDLLERAVQLHRAVGAGDERELTAELLCVTHLLAVRRALGGYNALLEEGALMERAREIAERVGRQDVLARLLWAEWAGLDTACDLTRSAPILEELRELAERVGDPLTRVMALQGWGIHCWHLGRITEAGEHLDAAAALTEELDASSALAMDFEQEQELLPQPFALYVHELIGDLDDMEARFARLSMSQDHPFSRAVVQMFAAAGALATADYPRAAAEARRGLDSDPTLAFTFWGCGTQAYLGCALAMLGEVDEGVAMVRSALPRFVDSGARTGLPIFHARVAQALGRAGRLDEAAVALGDAARALEELTEAWAAPIVDAVAAELDLRRGSGDEEIAVRFCEAAALARMQGAHGVARGIEATASQLHLV